MDRSRYGYPLRRRRPTQHEWWLALPLALVIGLVILGSRLPEAAGGLPASSSPAASSACPTGENCTVGAPPPLACAPGDACAASQDRPPIDASAVPPTITGRAAAIIEEPCGALLYADNAHDRLAPASLTKIATALVALERADLAETVDVRINGVELSASTDSTVMGLEPGQRMSVRDLLFGLLLPSGNDAAIAIAEHVSGDLPAFVDLMNAKVNELGLGDTHFANPHGLDDPDLYTSAFDIAMLGRELIRQPELAAIVRTPTYQPAWDGPPVWNGNRLLNTYPGSIGVKTGFTDEAGGTIVAAADRDGRRLVVSVLGSSAIYDDAITLMEWAFTDETSACN